MPGRGVFLGRFQPIHLGHVEAARRLAAQHDELILAIGSANVSHTATNPFTGGERVEMARAALAEAGLRNVVVLPIPDVGRNAVWVAHVASLVPRFQTLYSNNPLPARLFSEAGYKVAPVPFVDRDRYEATRIRRAIASGGAWKALVPPAVARLVEELDGPARIRDLLAPDGVVEGHDPSL